MTRFTSTIGAGDGLVLAFDEVISTNYLTVLDSDNYPYSSVQLSGPCVTGGGASTRIWMADANTNGRSVGVLRWDTGSQRRAGRQ